MVKEFFVHETAVIDEGATIGAGTSIWHFSHLMKGCKIDEMIMKYIKVQQQIIIHY